MPGGFRDRERDRSRERDRRYRDYKSNKEQQLRRSPDYYSSDEDNYETRRKAKSSHDRSRKPDKESYRERSRSREYERDRERNTNHNYYANSNYSGENDYDYSDKDNDRDRRYNKHEEAPNSTLMIRGLAPHITENDVMNKLDECGLKAKDIRLMRRKDTGASRGFAFVEFSNINEAIQWKDMNQGCVIFGDDTKATLHYSIPKDALGSERNPIQKYDWTCYKCGVNNFKRREQCFKCGTPREESAANEPGDDISPTPTNCLLLRNLAPHTTEERILTVLGTFTAMPIKSIRISRDSVYGVSRGICFVELHTTLEASQLYALLSSLSTGFVVDDFPLTACYAKRNVSSTPYQQGAVNVASVALAAAQWTNQTELISPAVPITQSIPSLPNAASNSIIASSPTTQDLNVPSAPVQQSTIVNLGTVSVNGVIYPKYSSPETNTYQYDENSGYYYDAKTGLYYDTNSHYYYNPTTQSYLYWSEEHHTYLPADTKATASRNTVTSDPASLKTPINNHQDDKRQEKSTEKPDKLEKQDKVKIAKKIAKDMEKWAKTLNQKKEIARRMNPPSIFVPEDDETPSVSTASHFTPIGHSVTEPSSEIPVTKDKLERKQLNHPFNSKAHHEEKLHDTINPDSEDSSSRSPTHSDSMNILQAEELRLIDWVKLVCKLCKRQFTSKDQLIKHQQASDLHKTNLMKLSSGKFSDDPFGEFGKGDSDSSYRDRAKERRLKYGQPETPEPTKHGDKPPAPFKPKSVEGIGNKMLKAMGWSEGQGLGRSNQGTSSIIEVERRAAGVGLGIKTTSTGAGESYKDAVKRASWLRFQQLSEKE